MKKKEPRRITLTLIFAIIVFLILTITMLILSSGVFFAVRMGWMADTATPSLINIILLLAIVSIIVGTIVGLIVSKFPLKPVNKAISGMNNLAEGNYETRLSFGQKSIGRELEESFNKLAWELQNTEMFRSDFVNNFSHEFKTPLVSIRGFARLLQKDNLSEEKRNQYLQIIVDESNRLATLSTHVLNLTKLENQQILTDQTNFNLSEQIRQCFLLLEKEWQAKDLSIKLSEDDFYIHANEKMLKQVWINLIDNAIKYSETEGLIEIQIEPTDNQLNIKVINYGEAIPEIEINRIFQKFYQTDTSHTSEGNGIGLAIVKRIIDLHGGKITVESNSQQTVFEISLSQD